MKILSRNKQKTIKSKTMRNLWILGAPTVLEQALQTLVGYVDTAMVGHIGAAASAAVGLTVTVNWLFNGIFFAMSVGLLSYIARFTGEGDMESAHRTSVQALWVMLVFGVIETILALAVSPVLPRWMGASREIWHEAGLYFFIISCPMMLRGAAIIYGNVLRANKDSKSPMLANVFANLLNIILNQLLIGNGMVVSMAKFSFTIPGAGWGVAGAAIATAISQGLCGIIIFAVAMRNPLTTIKEQKITPDRKILGACAGVALPLIGERFVVSGGHVIFSSLVASLGTLSTAAHSIALTVEEAFYIPGYGIQTAVSTLSGNAVGKRDEEELREVTKAGLKIAVSVMTAMSIFLFFCSPLIMKLFSNDQAVILLGAKLLKIVAVSEPLFAVLIIFEGVFHGIGETKVPFCIALFTMWGIRIFCTWLCINQFHAGLTMVWVCMVMDNICRCMLLVLWYRLKRWKKRLDI